MAKDVQEALAHALMDAYDIGHGGGHVFPTAVRAEARMVSHDGDEACFEAWVVDGDGKRPPLREELPSRCFLSGTCEPYEGAGYRIAHLVCPLKGA